MESGKDTQNTTEETSHEEISAPEINCPGYEELEEDSLVGMEYIYDSKAKWNDLMVYSEETVKMQKKALEYKKDLYEELVEVETERNLLLIAAESTRDSAVTDQCKEMVEVDSALRKLTTNPRNRLKIRRVNTRDYVCNIGKKTESSSTVASRVQLGDEKGSAEKCAEIMQREIMKAVLDVKAAISETDEAASVFNKLREEYSKRGQGNDDHVDNTKIICGPVEILDGAPVLRTRIDIDPKALVKDESPGEQVHIGSAEIKLACEIELAKIQYDMAREKIVSDTVKELRTWKAKETEIRTKYDKLMGAYKDNVQENSDDNKSMDFMLKNIESLSSYLSAIETLLVFIKSESREKLSRIKVDLDLKALHERLLLARAINLLELQRKKPSSIGM